MRFSSYPGVQFAPTDEEVVTHYLANILKGIPSRYGGLFKELNVYATEPWNLPSTHVTVKDQVTGERRVVGHVAQLCYIRDGEKVSSNWVMKEYTLADHKPHDDQEEFEEWAICRIKLNAVTEKRNKKDQRASNS
ncbi:uncharacterized protein A4U43_C08F8230 [Asparagus officinalis]|nr:uncharacterized protein A4U43_C08F8230 [Asparagus officinalis]